ncbi:MAG: tryptophan synthase subunit alpha [Candidatus Taylorbacteria bacterium CG11_big_fil_rev_8_21_14_0_20_46_11]|uniref:Tryptophan synthase alpha chain n=1 Tax=Candidatus Taylorbacteria bacterium CG11_big_fil_rev_8_21_14_0_20_46_11 TaxID=1975025 RepID=A0A2H0KD96_9BACT|nr:MAG: tryptophan synthase subunit alpha [Candidatus Taylorbacteria bacterium CG11_big_fil_rev_8_21_14_0_20_46_11]
MSNISKTFAKVKQEGRIAFMPFVVAGDPTPEVSLSVIKRLVAGADLLELGFPYSDPLADGPTIQSADMRALSAGMTTKKVFELVQAIRTFSNIPITVLVYANLVYQQGIDEFYRRAKEAGIDGVLVPDVPVEEAKPFMKSAKAHRIDPIFLVAQTTTPERLKKILKHAKGFLYLVSVLGVTGARTDFSDTTTQFISSIRAQTTLPCAVGFGIKTREQALMFGKAGADGAIVGSAIVDIVAKLGDSQEITEYTKQFSALNSPFVKGSPPG